MLSKDYMIHILGARKWIAAMTLAFSTALFAGEGPGFYGGGSVGLSLYEDEEDELNSLLTAAGIIGTVETDVTDLGWKIYGGYRFSPYFGAEVGYIDLGEASADIGSVSVSSGVSGVSIAGTAGYPVADRGYVFGKLGAFIWDASTETEGPALLLAVLPAGVVSGDDNGVDLTFGVGGTFELVEHVKLRAEWEHFLGLGDPDTDIDLFSGGVQYDF
jgi:OOP family OmpA-OmpF porin